MAYGDFTLNAAERNLGLSLRWGSLFEGVPEVAVPPWLGEALERGWSPAFLNEVSRLHFIVTPILLTVRQLSGNRLALYPGQRLDVDPARGLVGECDYILALTEQFPELRAPVAVLLEAKRGDVEAGLGQCTAQMVGAQVYNRNQGNEVSPIFGCVTTGERWQFLHLDGSTLTLDQGRYYIIQAGTILGIFQEIASRCHLVPASA